MSSSVCQGLQSCLEPRLVEPRVLIQNLAPQKSALSQSIPRPQKPNLSQPQHDQNEIIHNKNIIINNHYYSFLDPNHLNKDGDLIWSSIQALANTSHNCKQVPEADQVYVHQLVKRSSSTLSAKSLDMCTESLGSETGSSIGESMDDFPSPLPERSNYEGTQRSRPQEIPKRMDRSVSFPPPLTSRSGPDGVQMRPHREGGRLVLKAMTVAPCSSLFQIERANGRLTLSLLKGSSENDFNSVFEQKAPNYVMHDDEVEQEVVNADEEEVLGKNAQDDDKTSDMEDNNLEVNGENVGYEVGVGEFPRPSRCKEGGSRNKGISSWGPFWVAIS